MSSDEDPDGWRAGQRRACPQPVPDASGRYLTGSDDGAARDGQAAERLQSRDNLDRRLADRKLVETLSADGFTGRRYEQFQANLIAYGIPVLQGWMYSGHIFKLTAGRGYPLTPTPDELEELSNDPQVRDELANMTVALALPRFRQEALIRGGWRVDGGASLTSYFMGSCLSVFPNEFRSHRGARSRWRRAHRLEATHLDPAAGCEPGPDVVVPGTLEICGNLADLDQLTAAVVALRLDGYSHGEIAELLDLPSARVAEGILYRWRNKQKRKMAGIDGGEDDAAR